MICVAVFLLVAGALAVVWWRSRAKFLAALKALEKASR
jgi:hypothetical protein